MLCRLVLGRKHTQVDRVTPVVIIHLPHTDKVRGTKRTVEIVKAEGMNPDRVIIDHNTEETMAFSKASGCYCGMTVYPISKLTPQRVSNIIRSFGSDRMIVNGSADWGVSDPLSLVRMNVIINIFFPIWLSCLQYLY